MKTIVATNIRGGCGKTTNVLHLAIAASKAKKKNRVLAIDLDPQAHLTDCLIDAEKAEANRHFIDHFLGGEIFPPLETHYKNLSVIPSRMELTKVQDSGLLGTPAWERHLAKAIDRVKENFDYIFIDTPAAYFKLHVLALVASDAYIISMRPEVFSLKGFVQSISEIETFKENLSVSNPIFAGYFLNGVPKAKRNAINRIRDHITEEYTTAAYEIPQSINFDECRWSNKTSIFLFPGTEDLRRSYVNSWKDMSNFLEK
jgi:cellulose biosynthesis protein BcsQ